MALYLEDGYHGEAAAYAPANERVAFIRRTYLHLAGSVAALVAMDAFLLHAVQTQGGKEFMAQFFRNPISLLVVLAFFIGGGFLARYLARAQFPPVVKYAGLALYTVIEALFLLPILWYATNRYGMDIVNQAALMTLVTFGGLSLAVFITKKDFSFLGYGLMVASFLLLGVVLVAVLLPGSINLGLGYSFLVIALAAGFILYDTSNVLHHYSTDEHVGASLELLADVVLLFYHLLRVLILSRED